MFSCRPQPPGRNCTGPAGPHDAAVAVHPGLVDTDLANGFYKCVHSTIQTFKRSGIQTFRRSNRLLACMRNWLCARRRAWRVCACAWACERVSVRAACRACVPVCARGVWVCVLRRGGCLATVTPGHEGCMARAAVVARRPTSSSSLASLHLLTGGGGLHAPLHERVQMGVSSACLTPRPCRRLAASLCSMCATPNPQPPPPRPHDVVGTLARGGRRALRCSRWRRGPSTASSERCVRACVGDADGGGTRCVSLRCWGLVRDVAAPVCVMTHGPAHA